MGIEQGDGTLRGGWVGSCIVIEIPLRAFALMETVFGTEREGRELVWYRVSGHPGVSLPPQGAI